LGALAFLLAAAPALAGEADFEPEDFHEHGHPYFGEAKDIKGLGPVADVRMKVQVKGTMRFFIVQTDADGTRQATLLVPVGTEATLHAPDGSTEGLPTMNVRITEFTVGANGPSTMPAALPPESQYTHAFEIDSDEALAAEAEVADLFAATPLPATLRAALAQARRSFVPEDVERGEHGLARLGGDAGLVVEDARHGRLADPSLGSDVEEASRHAETVTH